MPSRLHIDIAPEKFRSFFSFEYLSDNHACEFIRQFGAWFDVAVGVQFH